MAYFFYAISFIFLIAATVIYATRSLWISHAPPIPYLTSPGPIPDWLYALLTTLKSHPPLSWLSRDQRYVQLPNSASSPSSSPSSSGFESDLEAGFSSSNFDLTQNIADLADTRRGLDHAAKQEVQRIMKARGCGFDDARKVFVEERFGRENIGVDGRPLDTKAVMFDRLPVV